MLAMKVKRNANAEPEYPFFGINEDIERIVQECYMCMTYRDAQLKQPLISHHTPM